MLGVASGPGLDSTHPLCIAHPRTLSLFITDTLIKSPTIAPPRGPDPDPDPDPDPSPSLDLSRTLQLTLPYSTPTLTQTQPDHVPEEACGYDAQRLPVEAAAEAVQHMRLHRQRCAVLKTIVMTYQPRSQE